MYPGKRVFDVTFSPVGILVFSPVLLVTARLIALLDGRPIFFTPRRLGLNKQEFTVNKFRTMTAEGAVGHSAQPVVGHVVFGSAEHVLRPAATYSLIFNEYTRERARKCVTKKVN